MLNKRKLTSNENAFYCNHYWYCYFIYWLACIIPHLLNKALIYWILYISFLNAIANYIIYHLCLTPIYAIKNFLHAFRFSNAYTYITFFQNPFSQIFRPHCILWKIPTEYNFFETADCKFSPFIKYLPEINFHKKRWCVPCTHHFFHTVVRGQ